MNDPPLSAAQHVSFPRHIYLDGDGGVALGLLEAVLVPPGRGNYRVDADRGVVHHSQGGALDVEGGGAAGRGGDAEHRDRDGVWRSGAENSEQREQCGDSRGRGGAGGSMIAFERLTVW